MSIRHIVQKIKLCSIKKAFNSQSNLYTSTIYYHIKIILKQLYLSSSDSLVDQNV